MMNYYDFHLILSAIANQIEDIEKYDRKGFLHLLNDYKCLYYKVRKELLPVSIEDKEA